MADLLPVADAGGRLLALKGPVPVEEAPLGEAVGRWLSQPLIARRDQPSADLSAMDGYALRFAELDRPLKVVGESAAGKGFSSALAAGEAVRIFTGAPVPAGADTILVQEDAGRDGDLLRWAEGADTTSLLDVRRDRLRLLVAASPSGATGPADLLATAALPSAAGGARVAVRRRLLEQPVLTTDGLPAEQAE